jgi:hypothetical protein
MIIATISIDNDIEEIDFENQSDIKNEYDFKYYILSKFDLVNKNIDIQPVEKIFNKHFKRVYDIPTIYIANIQDKKVVVQFVDTNKHNLTIGF